MREKHKIQSLNGLENDQTLLSSFFLFFFFFFFFFIIKHLSFLVFRFVQDFIEFGLEKG